MQEKLVVRNGWQWEVKRDPLIHSPSCIFQSVQSHETSRRHSQTIHTEKFREMIGIWSHPELDQGSGPEELGVDPDHILPHSDSSARRTVQAFPVQEQSVERLCWGGKLRSRTLQTGIAGSPGMVERLGTVGSLVQEHQVSARQIQQQTHHLWIG